MLQRITLKKNEDKRIREGHLWIFSNEIETPSKDIQNGELVEVFNNSGVSLGVGFFNRNSLIIVRIVSRKATEDLKTLFTMRLNKAAGLRKEMYPERNSYRFVFSESDLMPGLIIDKYNNSFALQIYSAGMEKNIQIICDILKEQFGAENIFTRNENYFRKLEGLPEEDSVYLGEIKDEIISDGKIKFNVDFAKGHKTGFYFDQSDNRYFIERIVKDKSVVDAFCNSGGFGIHALAGGAKKVLFIDSSANEIEAVKNNLKLNGITSENEFIARDVFDAFNELIETKRKFDVVMIDPPAFAKSKKSLPTALKGYEKLNRLAMQIVENEGYLVTSSCSFHLKEQDFFSVVKRAAAKAGKIAQIVNFNRASLDHPMLPQMEETSYLKFMVLKVSEI